MFIGFMLVLKFSGRLLVLFKIYVDNEYNWRLGRVGMEYGLMVVLRDLGGGSFSGIKYYVDNFVNRSFGWVGFLYGVCGEEVCVYKDNFFNWKLGCVGLFIGVVVKFKFGFLELKLYVDNLENCCLGRVGFLLGFRFKGFFLGLKWIYCDNYLNR